MSPADPLERRYGFGAAGVPLCPPSTGRASEVVPLLQGLRALRAEHPGALCSLSRHLAPPLLAGVLLALLLASAVARRDPTTIVPFADAPPPAPEPVVELAERPPEPIPAVADEPEPPPQALVAQPPPAPEPASEPLPSRQPKPALPALALSEPATATPPTRSRPRPAAARPAPAPRPVPGPERLVPPETQELARSSRAKAPAFPRARTRTARPDLAAASPVPAAPAPSFERQRPAAPAPRADTSRRRISPGLSAPAGQLPLHDEAPAPTRRSGGAVASARSTSRRPRPSLAGPAAPRSGGELRSPPPRRAPATRPAAPAAPGASQGGAAPGAISGVPLASLAACVSDAREQALKERIVAAVGSRRSCRSSVGRYHFVETKNVNAFLMRIERASGRRVGDRCAELTYALDCLSR